MGTKISSKYESEKLESRKIEDLIDILEDRTKGWVIEPAQKILKLKNGFYPGACILTSYFEGIMIYKHGEDSKDRSKQFFGNVQKCSHMKKN
jgi:hypothetical protein